MRKAKRNTQGAGTIRKRAGGKQIQKSIYGEAQKAVREKLAQITTELRQLHQADTGRGPALGADHPPGLTLLQQPAGGKETLTQDCRNMHGVFHKALEQAMELGMIRNNPTDLCDLPKVRRKEIKAFLKAIEDCKFELLYRVTLFTGMRQGEVLEPTWDYVDFEHNALYINEQLQKTQKVGGQYVLAPTKSSRMITVAPSVMVLLKKQKSQQTQMRLLAGDRLEGPLGLGVYQ